MCTCNVVIVYHCSVPLVQQCGAVDVMLCCCEMPSPWEFHTQLPMLLGMHGCSNFTGFCISHSIQTWLYEASYALPRISTWLIVKLL